MSAINTTNTANMFIVPNHAHTLIEDRGCDNMILQDHNRKIMNFGLGDEYMVNYGDTLVEVWITGCGSDNWSCHEIPEEFGDGYFTPWIPARLLAGKKEGDHIEMTVNGHPIKVVANQRSFRYRNYGDFEDVLDRVIK